MSQSPVVPPGLKSLPGAAPESAIRPVGAKKHAGYHGVPSDEEDDAEDEENAGKTPAQLTAERVRRLRRARQAKVAMKWTLSDPVMAICERASQRHQPPPRKNRQGARLRGQSRRPLEDRLVPRRAENCFAKE